MLPLSTKEGGKRKTTVVGPWGGNGGIPWDDGIYNGVREITVVYGHCIDSITLVYDKNGKPVKANTHGGRGGTQTAEVCLAARSFHFIWTSIVMKI
nr:jacalin-related lectin 19 [Malus domestica]